MSKIHYWDNLVARWLMRHFYFMFFQVVLFVIFLFWFVNMFKVIDDSFRVKGATLLDQISATQSVNLTIIVLLLLLNSFWMLYMFNAIQRLNNTLKDISFGISRMRSKPRS